MIYIILKTIFENSKPKKLFYRDFKNVKIGQFKSDIYDSMNNVKVLNNVNVKVFENNFVSISNKHSPKKTKILRRNQKPQF